MKQTTECRNCGIEFDITLTKHPPSDGVWKHPDYVHMYSGAKDCPNCDMVIDLVYSCIKKEEVSF